MSRVPLPGIRLIKQFEGCHLEAYPDPLSGGKPYTIGWGSTRRKDGSPFSLGEKITQAEADDLLTWQVERQFLPALERIPAWSELNENQRGALLSFAYNLGAKFYGASGFSTITRVLQERRWDQMESALLLYRNPGSNVEEGLRRRRQAEADLFNAPSGQFPKARVTQPSASSAWDGRPRLLLLTTPPMTGEDVLEVQKLLARTGAGITLDGVFGLQTKLAIERFQSVNQVTPDGIVGPQTLELLRNRVLYYTQPPLQGDDVAAVQQALLKYGFRLTANGQFDQTTQKAVQDFQSAAGLTADGIVGPRTRQLLTARVLYLSTPYMTGADVEAVQQQLASLGIAVTADGVFGPGTERAIRAFQQIAGLTADGRVGPQTLSKLLDLRSVPTPSPVPPPQAEAPPAPPPAPPSEAAPPEPPPEQKTPSSLQQRRLDRLDRR
jgi:peptidoglycan hydrolase-like protein with peptidoglycan-binding domain/GH24 family phage-related lysozyme (muramidase)